MEQRIDEIEKYYKPVSLCEKWTWYTFLFSAALSFIIPYTNHFQIEFLKNVITITFILLVVSHVALAHFNGLYLTPKAERMRRRQLLSNSLNIPLTHEKTEFYYNNKIEPSVFKLGANILENSFFSINICNEMAKKERTKCFVYFLIWFIAIINRSTDLGLITTLTQVIFSGEVLFRWIKFEIYRIRNESIYDKLHQLFLHKTSENSVNVNASILDAFAEYETTKAYGISQSSKIFHQLNHKLTLEWNDIKEQLKFE